MLAQSKSRGAATPLKDLGPHPEDQQPVGVFEGRYGPYVKHGKVFASVPKDRDPASVTLPEALTWLAERVAKGTKTRRAARSTRTTSAAKSSSARAKKTPAAKKTSTRKK
jgi:DNA topoisomerase-1